MRLATLSPVPITQRDVEIAWATYRSLILAEVEDPTLRSDMAHQEAIERAQERFARLYEDWSRQ